jgi:transcription-repair coupling factor (superfamily II helicase)
MPDVFVEKLVGNDRENRERVLANLASGKCQVVIGTHALLNDKIEFKNLGLVVVDEEQKFGVAQKELLRSKYGVDILTLTATPIPRTLQMSLSGLRDISRMDSPPTGRKEVIVDFGPFDGEAARQAIEFEMARGGQCFVVVPHIADIAGTCETLAELCPSARIIEAHGQHRREFGCRPADKRALDAVQLRPGEVMDDRANFLLEDRVVLFEQGKADVLVATTVVENGVDIPNANTILVCRADHFGRAQLHQLRGRVGRSDRQAYAYFFTNSSRVTVATEERLLDVK